MQQPRTNCFGRMNRDHGRQTILIPEKVMAALHPDHFKSCALKRCDEFLAGQTREPTHAAIVIR